VSGSATTHRDRIAENGRIFDFELTGEELSQLDALDRSGLPGTLLNADGGETAGGRPSQSRDPDRSRLGDPLAGLPLGGGRQTGL
jgi:hypothetical protein